MNLSFWEGALWTLITIALAMVMAWIVVGPPWANGIVGPLWVGVIKREIRKLEKRITTMDKFFTNVATQLTEGLTEVSALLAEGFTEVTGKLAELEAEIVALKEQAANPETFAPALAKLDEVKAKAQTFADLIPNAQPPADGGDEGDGGGDTTEPSDPPADDEGLDEGFGRPHD